MGVSSSWDSSWMAYTPTNSYGAIFISHSPLVVFSDWCPGDLITV